MKRQSCHHLETSQLICKANQLTGFYMRTTLAFDELKTFSGMKTACENHSRIKLRTKLAQCIVFGVNPVPVRH